MNTVLQPNFWSSSLTGTGNIIIGSNPAIPSLGGASNSFYISNGTGALIYGDLVNGNLAFGVNGTTLPNFQGAQGAIFMAASSVPPTTPATGGVLLYTDGNSILGLNSAGNNLSASIMGFTPSALVFATGSSQLASATISDPNNNLTFANGILTFTGNPLVQNIFGRLYYQVSNTTQSITSSLNTLLTFTNVIKSSNISGLTVSSSSTYELNSSNSPQLWSISVWSTPNSGVSLAGFYQVSILYTPSGGSASVVSRGYSYSVLGDSSPTSCSAIQLMSTGDTIQIQVYQTVISTAAVSSYLTIAQI